MATDRAALEKAIECVLVGYPHGRDLPNSNLGRVVAAARAHLDTLPRTKMVEVWHVEWTSRVTDEMGVWVVNDKTAAEDRALRVKRDGGLCVRVTGPHSHEVPST